MKPTKLILSIFLIALLAIATNILGIIVNGGIGELLIPLDNSIIELAICNVVSIAFVIGLCVLWNKYVFKKSLPKLLDEFKALGKGRFVIWMVLGLLLPLLLVGIFSLLNAMEFTMYKEVSWYKAALLALLFASAAGFMEELAYRYILYGYLKRKTSINTAIIISGLIFGAVHLPNAGTLQEAITLIFGGIAVTYLFASIYEYSGSVWAGAIVHTFWNAATSKTGFIFTNTMANEDADGYYRYMAMKIQTESDVLSGGSFGIETSIITLLLYVLVATIIFLLIKNRKAVQ